MIHKLDYDQINSLYLCGITGALTALGMSAAEAGAAASAVYGAGASLAVSKLAGGGGGGGGNAGLAASIAKQQSSIAKQQSDLTAQNEATKLTQAQQASAAEAVRAGAGGRRRLMFDPGQLSTKLGGGA
jgi:hypothetical protein